MSAYSQIEIHRTSRETGERLLKLAPAAFRATGDSQAPSVTVDVRHADQQIVGFGGAFTEAAAVNYMKMNPEVRRELLQAYFDPVRGHGYQFCRTQINSCDFSLGNYAYAETEGDTDFKHFTLDRDRKALIPMIKDALKASPAAFKLFASPWSPPAWMKTNGQMNHGGRLKPEYRDAWARYYARYIREMEKEGISIWALTVQNEPMAIQRWDSCIYSAEEERNFVRDHLGPVLEKEGLGHVKIIVWDHNRDHLFERARVILDDPDAARRVWGVGFHWYNGDHFENVRLVHELYPDKALIFTEGCQEHGPHLGDWRLAERYARSILNDLNRGTAGIVDWNLVLDEEGGPNHVGNFCAAPIHLDTRSGRLIYQPSYFAIGHFARFIKPGARRILCGASVDALQTTAFRNPDGSIAVVVLNQTDYSIHFELRHENRAAPVESSPQSIITLVLGC